jgi:hypothetical protein
MNKAERADLVWKTLFVDNTPLSEATRGIVTLLEAFGLDSRAENLEETRSFFRSRDLKEHFNLVLERSSVSKIVMTNDPFSEHEAWIWKAGEATHPRFHASLRLDVLLIHWEDAVRQLAREGLPVNAGLSGETCERGSALSGYLD